MTKDKVKDILIQSNERAFNLLQKYYPEWIEEQPEYEPLIFETLAYDLVYLDHGIQENIFRYATHKYDLQNDSEVRSSLDYYLSS